MKITANRLTLLRIILLPLPCFLLYGGPSAKLTALGIGSLLGLTDYFDGLLARRQGATKLGAFLDPIADKIFVTVVFLFLTKLSLLPFWVVALILAREFLVAALRLKVPGNLPVNWLAKVKTASQMLTAALTIALAAYPAHARVFTLAAAGLFLAGAFFSPSKGYKRLLLLVCGLILPGLSLLSFSHQVLALGLFTLFITWASAVPYLKQAFLNLKKKDALMIGPEVALPLLIMTYLLNPSPFWLLVPVVLTLELIKKGLYLLGGKTDSLYGIWLVFGLLAALLPEKMTPLFLLLFFFYQAEAVLRLFFERRAELFGQ